MLHEKVTELHKLYTGIHQAHAAIELAQATKKNIADTCRELKAILEGGGLATIDEEIRTAITSVYNIFESASKALDSESVAALFTP